jgi:hypothetical protein
MKRPLLCTALSALFAGGAHAQQISGNTVASGVSSITTSCPASGAMTGAVTLSGGPGAPNAQTGASYAIATTDCGGLITLNNASAVAVSLSQATTTGFGVGFGVTLQNLGAGTVTVTPSTSTINGASTLVLTTGQSAKLVSDGTNYFAQVSAAGGGGIPHPGYVSGVYYNMLPGMSAVGGSAQVASTVYCTQMFVGSGGMVTKAVAAQYSTGATGGHISWALYAALNGRPNKLIDFVTGADQTGAGSATFTWGNGTDALPAGDLFLCETHDNATAVIGGISNGTTAVSWALGNTAIANAGGLNSMTTGLTCTAASTCGTGFAVWSGSTFTWPSSFTNPTWTYSHTTDVPMPILQAN